MTRSLPLDLALIVSIKLALLVTLYLCVVRPIGIPASDARTTAAAVAGTAMHESRPVRKGVGDDAR